MSPPPTLEDATAMAVFADQLQGCGDPRGELVQLQLAREHAPFDARLERAEAACLARHDRALLGALRTATSLFQLTWRRGFIVQAQLQSWSGATVYERGRWVEPPQSARSRLPRLVRELLALESARPLRALTVLMPFSSFSTEQLLACADEVVRARHPALEVLVLHLLEPVPRNDWSGQWTDDWAPAPTTEFRAGRLDVSVSASLAARVRQRL